MTLLHMRRLACVVALIFFWGCAGEPRTEPEAPTPGEWPQWRGAGGMGVSAETDLPEVWSATSPNIRWQVEVPGAGNSAPIVSRGRVFLTTSYADPDDSAQTRRAVLGLDFATGDLLWETVVLTAPREKMHRLNTSAAPTAVTDGRHVYAYFGSHLARLDFDGNIVWNRDIDPEYAKYSRYAIASSPVLIADKVIVVQDQEEGKSDDIGWMAAFDKESGERLWRHEWDHTCCSYSTPLVVGQDADLRMFFAHSGAVAEYDVATGEPLWSHDYRILQMVPSITIAGDILCIAGGAHNVKGVTCLRLSGRGRQTQVEVLWATNQGAPETASPILHDGHLYAVTEKGILTCVDIATGKQVWRRRLAKGRYHGSMVAGDGKLYIDNGRGLTSVVAAAPKFELIAENQLDEGGNSTPAIAGGYLLIRTKRKLVCIGKDENRLEP